MIQHTKRRVEKPPRRWRSECVTRAETMKAEVECEISSTRETPRRRRDFFDSKRYTKCTRSNDDSPVTSHIALSTKINSRYEAKTLDVLSVRLILNFFIQCWKSEMRNEMRKIIKFSLKKHCIAGEAIKCGNIFGAAMHSCEGERTDPDCYGPKKRWNFFCLFWCPFCIRKSFTKNSIKSSSASKNSKWKLFAFCELCRYTMKFISFEIPYEISLVGWAALCALFYALIYAKLAKLLVQFSTFTVVARLLRCPLTPNSNFEPLQRTYNFFIPTPHVGRPRVFGYMSSVHLFIISLLEWKLNALLCIYDKSFEIRCAQESSDFLLFKSLYFFFSLCCFVFFGARGYKNNINF